MTISTNTLRPGLLVSLKTSLRGNVKYDKVDLDASDTVDAAFPTYSEQHDHVVEVTKWETTRTIEDAAEYEAGKKAQSKASSLIRSACTKSAFGLLCPEAQAWRLEDAIAEAHAVVDKFNATAQLSRLSVYVIAGKVASDDVEAVKAINGEVRELIDELAIGVQKLDVAAIRATANKARELGNVLTPEASLRVAVAVQTARDVAKQIVRAGENAAVEVNQFAIEQLKYQRTAFLDLSDEVQVERPASAARTIDLTPEDNNNAV